MTKRALKRQLELVAAQSPQRAGLPQESSTGQQELMAKPGAGPGTGKTYIAIAKAVEALEAGKVGRIVLSRPAVEAGESHRLPAGRHGRQAGPLSAPALRRL
jgi:hypothetical protein